MLSKPFAWIVVCLIGVVAAGLWFIFPQGVSTERHGRAVSQGAAGGGDTVPPAVPAPAAGPTPTQATSPLAPLPSDSLPTPTAAVPSAPPAPVTPGAVAERTVDPAVAHLVDASIPVETRSSEVEQLGKIGDANAVRTLMQLGDTEDYLNYKAVEVLGSVKTSEVARYLEGKLGAADPKIVAYAMQSLTQVQGAEAIPAIAAAIAANRQRPDGYQDTVCAAGVKALGEIGSAKAIPALAEEIEKTVGKTLLHEYGSQVVAAIKAIGDASGAPALKGYLARLEKEHAAMAGNPMGQQYLEGKIKETNEALASLLE
ncbi:MAG: hypothetical protein H7831_16110 [Magnetococcus sp. WYHC-3]